MRDLSISLNNLGGIAEAQGDWAQAEAVHRESLALRRQLLERLGKTPQALEDLASTLLRLADLPAGNAALKAEAFDIHRELAEKFSQVPRYAKMRDALVPDRDPARVSDAESGNN